jgi:hypothetical protein
MHRHTFSIALALVVALASAACTSDQADDATAGPATGAASGPTPVETVTTPSPTPAAIPDQPPATRGPVASDCVEGWVTPRVDSAGYRTPLRVIRRVTGETGLEVVDMRAFDGPESPPSDKGYLLNVGRWYVKAFAKADQAFQGRFLIEARTYGIGLVAVAPYDTNGFRSPDWTGFQFDSGDTQPKAYPRLPGTWSGVPYDFVDGGAGLEMPGLPNEVAGCLSGT